MNTDFTSNELTQYLRVCADLAEHDDKDQDGLAYVAPAKVREAVELIERLTRRNDELERANVGLATESERRRVALEKASEALASAYQAAGILVMPEDDKRPSDKDQTELLDLLSRWETMTKEQIEEFLPWPKEWAALSGKHSADETSDDPEEQHSRRVQFEKYHAMSEFLMEFEYYAKRAADILAGRFPEKADGGR